MRDEPPTGKAVERCYAAALRDCKGVLSREHFMSRCVLEQIARADGTLSLLGPAWASEARLTPGALQSRVLCERHNSGQSNLDDTGNEFVSAFKLLSGEIARGHEGQAIRAAFSGWDVERWVLKAFVGLMASGNAGPKYKPPRDLLAILYERESFVAPAGLYVAMPGSYELPAFPGVGLKVIRNGDEIASMLIRIYGIVFALHLGPRLVSPREGLRHPGRLIIHYGNVQSRIDLTWPDGEHPETFEVVAWSGPSELP